MRNVCPFLHSFRHPRRAISIHHTTLHHHCRFKQTHKNTKWLSGSLIIVSITSMMCSSGIISHSGLSIFPTVVYAHSPKREHTWIIPHESKIHVRVALVTNLQPKILPSCVHSSKNEQSLLRPIEISLCMLSHRSVADMLFYPSDRVDIFETHLLGRLHQLSNHSQSHPHKQKSSWNQIPKSQLYLLAQDPQNVSTSVHKTNKIFDFPASIVLLLCPCPVQIHPKHFLPFLSQTRKLKVSQVRGHSSVCTSSLLKRTSTDQTLSCLLPSQRPTHKDECGEPNTWALDTE